MKLDEQGISVRLPEGWDVRISRTARDFFRSVDNPLMHAANFPLPPRRGDFGSGAVDRMGPMHTFVSLFEYGPASVGQPLFAAQGFPRDLDPDEFSPNALQRAFRGQAGVQRFFTEKGRAFSLYVVLGAHANRNRLVPRVKEFLEGVEVERR